MIREIPTCFLSFVTRTQTLGVLKWRQVSWKSRASPGNPRLTLSLKEPRHKTSQGILQPWSQEACFQPRTYLKEDKEVTWSFPGGSDGKETARNAGDLGSIPGLGRSPREGHGNPLQYSCLENPMDRGAWGATGHGSQRVRHDWATNTFQKGDMWELWGAEVCNFKVKATTEPVDRCRVDQWRGRQGGEWMEAIHYDSWLNPATLTQW